MPLVYQQNINDTTKLGVWYITEQEDFFLAHVPLQREITHPNKRLQHLAGRYLLKVLYPDFPYDLIRIADTKKPFLENDQYHFSISHSGKYAAVMVSPDYRVGVDVELVSAKANKVKHKFLSETEQQALKEVAKLPYLTFSDQLLTAAWSIKESLYKWKGSSEVDFIKHLPVIQMQVTENKGTAFCKILKDGEIDLTVHLMFLNGNCVSFVFTPVS